jgi:hypothetical protein
MAKKRNEIRCENEDLRIAVEKLNKTYFGGKLRIDTVGYFEEISMTTIGQAQWSHGFYEDWFGLGVNPILKFAAKKLNFDITETLLHELIHIWQYQNDKLDTDREGHGKWFNAKAMQIMEKSPKYQISRYATKEEAKLLTLLKAIRTNKIMGM